MYGSDVLMCSTTWIKWKPSMWSRDIMALKLWIEVLSSVVQLYATSGDKEMVYTFQCIKSKKKKSCVWLSLDSISISDALSWTGFGQGRLICLCFRFSVAVSFFRLSEFRFLSSQGAIFQFHRNFSSLWEGADLAVLSPLLVREQSGVRRAPSSSPALLWCPVSHQGGYMQFYSHFQHKSKEKLSPWSYKLETWAALGILCQWEAGWWLVMRMWARDC